MNERISDAAVSYTHLDVYKRQPLKIVKIWRLARKNPLIIGIMKNITLYMMN